MKVWMADLTYTQQTLSSDVFPAAVAGIIDYTNNVLPGKITESKIFKFPENLILELEIDVPDIIGFSSYIWNCNLGLNFAKVIKKKYPNIPIVMGGPNFPINSKKQELFMKQNSQIDFYVFKEGEGGWIKIIDIAHQNIKSNDIIGEIKKRSSELINTAFIDDDNNLAISSNIARMSNIMEMTSPYSSGLLDKFFGGSLLPIIQTNRGCPFTCTFCTEGQTYWGKVRKKSQDIINSEIEYIAKKINEYPDDKKRYELYISDSNFGMFKEDINTCSFIGKMQEKYGYPKYINVTTGKNNKERVLEAAKLVNGAIKVNGSVQSLDDEVLTSIKRKNISTDKLLDVAKQAQGISANAASEVILGLPADSKVKHFDTLRKLVDSSFNLISMYQLMMLPGTEMNTEESREKFGLRTKYRVLPRCFGNFKALDQDIVSVEIEEIAIENSTLSFQDYLDCRKMNLIVNIFYNEGIFEELVKIIENAGISPFVWLEKIYLNDSVARFSNFVNEFVNETSNELWDSRDDLDKFSSKKENIEKYISGDIGNNLLSKYKALSLTEYFDALCEVGLRSFKQAIKENDINDPEIVDLASEIIKFKQYRISNIFDLSFSEYSDKFYYDINSASLNISQDKDLNFKSESLRLENPMTFSFYFSKEQKSMIRSYTNLFGNDIAGLSKILSRVYLKQFFRDTKAIGK